MVEGKFLLALSPQAEADLTDILQYTLQTWGEAQMSSYGAVLDAAFHSLQDNPHLGHAHPALSSAHRVLLVGQHLIVYQIREGIVAVSRILHARMDVFRHVEKS